MMKTIKYNKKIVFVFENNEEIKEFESVLKDMRKSKISLQYYPFENNNKYSIHNGKPSIPEYDAGKTKSGLLTDNGED